MSLIIDAHGRRSLFVHIPKTGGMSILRAFGDARKAQLSRNGNACCKPIACANFMPHGCSIHVPPHALSVQPWPCFTFAVLRNPFSWYESFFRYQTHLGWPNWEPHRWHPVRELKSLAAPTFAKFMEAMIVRHPGFVTRLYEWFTGPPGLPSVDAILQTEFLDAQMLPISDRMGWGLSFPLPRVNDSPRSIPTEWPDGFKAEVLRFDRPIFERFYAGELANS